MTMVQMGHESRRGVVLAGRIGYAAEGIVYGVLGLLALMTAFGESGGRLTGSQGAIQEIGSQPFGQVLLWATALGMLCYAIWNGMRAALDPERKGMLKRVYYGVSSGWHVMLAIYAAQLAMGSSSSGGGGKTWVAKLLNTDAGPILVAIIGLIAIAFGLNQIYVAAKGKVGQQYASAPMSSHTRELSRKVARIGVFARGLVFPVIGASLIGAAMSGNSSQASSFGEALGKFASGPFGTFMLAFVAAGLVAYGVHLFFIARYGYLPEPR